MLFVAAAGKGTEPVPFNGNGGVAKPDIPDADISDSAAKKQAIWHWKIGNTLNQVDDISCIARGMHNARMLVCDSVSFDDIIVHANGKASKPLPLTDQFILQKHFLEAGRINPFDPKNPVIGSHYLYPLESELDKSFLFVYAYDFLNGLDQDPVAVSDSTILFSDFMPDPQHRSAQTARPGEQLTVTLGVPRVVVFQSLVCCKERDDFDPGGLLGGGRMIPHLMIMVNQPASNVFAKIHHKRPSQMKMLEHKEHHDHSNMNKAVENGLWADKNKTGLLPSPFWDDIFDCYLLGGKSGVFKVVRPDKGARPVNGAVKVFDKIALLGKDYENRDFNRLPRQGAFDNIHVAPTITTTAKASEPQFHTDKVYMAPFCEHDCLHMHWRWGKDYDAKQNLGWSLSTGSGVVPGKPYMDAGVPMVPENQFVDINLTGLSSYKYEVHAKGKSAASPLDPIPAGTYTFVNHHGSAYALSVNMLMFTAAKGLVSTIVHNSGEPTLTLAHAAEILSLDSVFLYWHLRWGGITNTFSPDEVKERVVTIDAAKVRDE